jgi:hypothetical protein
LRITKLPRDNGQILLVGSVSRPQEGWRIEDVFTSCADSLGTHASMLPDGEVGDHNWWIFFLPLRSYSKHPDLETLSSHSIDNWKPKHRDDYWTFGVREGRSLRFETLGYPDEAITSFQTFKRLRDSGEIAHGTRFMFAVPMPESATRPFVGTARDFELMWEAYTDALSRDLEKIVSAIPHDDLAIQLDICWEVAAVEELALRPFTTPFETLPEDPMERYVEGVRRIAAAVPSDVWLGIHLCYGSSSHQDGESSDTGHFCEILNLAASVDMTNTGIAALQRPIDFEHMPVQLSNGFDDNYYQPLSRLKANDARVYLGLIHLHDGKDGALQCIAIARKDLLSFGISTQCGWGRRPADQSVEALLLLHVEIATAIDWG